MKMFEKLLIETHSLCNRSCPTCLRQSYPTQRPMTFLPNELIDKVLSEAVDMGFSGPVGLVWFNEPLIDPRLDEIATRVKARGFYVYIDTNGDFITRSIPYHDFLDEMVIALYDKDSFDVKKEQIETLLKVPKLSFHMDHIVTHYSPWTDRLLKQIEEFAQNPCYDMQRRMIVSATGEMALCCEDIGLEFDLGNVRDKTLSELWFSPKHTEILETLSEAGGRAHYPYCRSCPRAG